MKLIWRVWDEGSLLAAAAMVIPASSALAVDATGCHFLEFGSYSRRFVECNVRNEGAVPIADLSYWVIVTETGRTVPWGKTEVRTTHVDGGIEPGEVVALTFAGPALPPRAKGNLTITVSITEARDLSGNPID